MKRIHTHYDNLKVTRHAPPEVIRAVYKTLSQKFHPDRNQGDARAERIMTIINAAYEVLSDPNKRREHDNWIAQQEFISAQKEQNSHQPRSTPQSTSIKSSLIICRIKAWTFINHIFKYSILYALVGFIIWNSITEKYGTIPNHRYYTGNEADVTAINDAVAAYLEELRSKPTEQKYYTVSPSTAQLRFVRPITAPNGQPWPPAAGYIKGYQILHADGLSTVTVDNSQNDADVFVKLVSLDKAKAYPVRYFYVPASRIFTVNKVRPGNYDIRYRDLDNGNLSRSEAFKVEEIRTTSGTQFSNLTITLYKVLNGNMRTYDLSENEF